MWYASIALLIYMLPYVLFKPKDVFQPEFIINGYFLALVGVGPVSLMVFFPDVVYGGYESLFWVVITGYVSINAGFLISRVISPDPDLARIRVLPGRYQGLKLVGCALLLVSLAAGVAYFFRAGGVPLLAPEKEAARVAALSVSGNGYFLYLMTAGAYGVFLLFMRRFANRADGLDINLVACVIAFVAIGALLTGTGSRRYVIWMLLYILMARHYLLKRMSPLKSILLAGLLLVFVSVFELLRNPDSETTASFAIAVMYRSVIYTSNLEKVFTAFSSIDGAMWGRTLLMDVATIMPGKQVDYQSWLKSVVGIEFEGFGIPPTIMGDLFVNFRYPGIVVGCVTFGFCVRQLYCWCLSRLNPLLGILVYIIMIEYMTKIVTSGLSAQMIGLIWGSVICVGIALASGLLKLKVK